MAMADTKMEERDETAMMRRSEADPHPESRQGGL